MKKILLLLFLILFLTGCPKKEIPQTNVTENVTYGSDTIRIESFDLESYEWSKKQEPINSELKKIIENSDIIGISSSQNDTALSYFIESQGKKVVNEYGYYIGYDSRYITLTDHIIVGGIQNLAMISKFSFYGNNLVIIEAKINPENATEEIKQLKSIYNYAQEKYQTSNILIMGKLYADCVYFNTQELSDMAGFSWLLNSNTEVDSYDQCAYERFITSEDFKQNLIKTYVYQYSDNKELMKSISSSYPIYLELKSGRNFISQEYTNVPKNYTEIALSSPYFIIGSWNLQVFGVEKANNPEILNKIVQTIKDNNFDIIFVQEIRDESDTAFRILCNSLGGDFECITSSRAGRTTSKEQYGIIYQKSVRIIDRFDYNPDTKDRWERPPYVINISKRNINYTIYINHLKPEDVQKEMDNLQSVAKDYENVIILGDLNVACEYYTNNGQNFKDWYWIIPNVEDTTSGDTVCAYDRFILNYGAYRYYKESFIDSRNLEVSDHYPIKLILLNP